MTVTVRASITDPTLLRVFSNHIGTLLKYFVLRWIAAWALGGLIAVMTHPALADEPVDLGDIRIEAATPPPGVKGGRSKLRFQIENNSRIDLHLIGISTSVAEKSELVARVGTKKTSVLQSIGVASDEILDLTTSHLHYEIYPLQQTIHSGDEFSMTLHFLGWSESTLVHVH